MSVWPWSTIARLRHELGLERKRTYVCGLAAMGFWNGLDDPNCYSDALLAVLRLRKEFDRYTEPPPGANQLPRGSRPRGEAPS